MACCTSPSSPLFHHHFPFNTQHRRHRCDPNYRRGRGNAKRFSSSRPFLSSRIAALNTGSDMSFQLQRMNATQGRTAGNGEMTKVGHGPEHLLVLVHGIMGSLSDWTNAEAELRSQLGSKFLIHVSSSNTYTKTLDGIDGAGTRLANEVMQVVKETTSLKKISFLAHSLGGLFTRYAIASLYSTELVGVQQDVLAETTGSMQMSKCSSKLGMIAGLEPINFITLATPHLGVRSNKQLPFLFGFSILEKIAAPIAPLLAGQTGLQLFLNDGSPGKPPLLLRMASDCEEKKYISSLAAFTCRTVYANVSYDHMVGWRTSSIRRESELVEPSLQSLEGYKHIVQVEYCPPVSTESPHLREATSVKMATQVVANQENEEYNVLIEGKYRFVGIMLKLCLLLSILLNVYIDNRGNDKRLAKSGMDESGCQFPLSNFALLRSQQYSCTLPDHPTLKKYFGWVLVLPILWNYL